MGDNHKKIKESLESAIKETRKAAELALQAADTAEKALEELENGES